MLLKPDIVILNRVEFVLIWISIIYYYNMYYISICVRTAHIPNINTNILFSLAHLLKE